MEPFRIPVCCYQATPFTGQRPVAAVLQALEVAARTARFRGSVADHPFPIDSHAYGDADQVELTNAAAATNAEFLVCTHKDLVKLPVEKLGDRPLWALTVEMQILAGADVLEAALEPIVKQVIDRSANSETV